MSILLLSLALAGAAPPPAAAADSEPTIVVTGISLSESERALRECLARKCPPNEDINAALGHAENLFVAGKYQDARAVTMAAIGRNHKYGKTFPIEVSDLYRANSRISAHLGEGRSYELSSTEMHRTLGNAFPKTDYRVIGADLEWADMYASLGRFDRARQVYRDAEKKAEAAGRPDLASIARVRAAWVFQMSGESWLARQGLEEIARDRSPSAKLGRVAALVLLARLDRNAGKLDTSNALIEETRSLHSKQPILLFAPKVDLPQQRMGEGDAEGESGSTTRLMATDNFEDRWADVGFWVTPDGKVSDAEILRSHGNTDWAKPLLRSIGGRVYSAIADA